MIDSDFDLENVWLASLTDELRLISVGSSSFRSVRMNSGLVLYSGPYSTAALAYDALCTYRGIFFLFFFKINFY